MKSFENFKIFFQKIITLFSGLTKGIFNLIFLEAFRDFLKAFKQHWNNSKDNTAKLATILSGAIIVLFLLHSVYGIYVDLSNWTNKEWRESVIFRDYEVEIKKFFDKYNEKFAAHDCNFMKEIAADEAMFDKYGKTSYGDDYVCEQFVKTQKKLYIPIEIYPITKTGGKYRVQGKILDIRINQGQPLKIDAVHFELWKKLDWSLWHFKGYSDGSRKIPIEKISD